MAEHARDVLAKRCEEYSEEPYNLADRLIMDLFSSGFEVVDAAATQALTDDAREGWAQSNRRDFTIDRLTGMLECYDGRYRYICEAGHTTVTSKATLDVCPAVVSRYGVPAVSGRGDPCCEPIEARVIPYERPADYDVWQSEGRGDLSVQDET